MSYLVTLQTPRSGDHLKAVAKGPQGILNCSFPKDNILGKYSRNDFSNAGRRFEIKNLVLSTHGNFYYISAREIMREIPKGDIVKQDANGQILSITPAGTAQSQSAQPKTQQNNTKPTRPTTSTAMYNRLNLKNHNVQLEERLFLEDYGINDFGELDKMSSRPFFKSGKTTIWAGILVKLYEACVNPGNNYDAEMEVRDASGNVIDTRKGISRAKLMKLSGAAGGKGDGERSGFFNSYKRLGLAYINPNVITEQEGIVFPGENLEAFMQGKITPEMGLQDLEYDGKTKKYSWAPYTQTQNMMGEIGNLDMPKKTFCSSKTKRPDLMEDPHAFDKFPGITLTKPAVNADDYDITDEIEKDKDMKVNKIPVQAAQPVKGLKFRNRNVALEESLNEAESFAMEYRNFCGLDPDCDIRSNFSEYNLKDMCCCNGWSYNYVRNKLLGEM